MPTDCKKQKISKKYGVIDLERPKHLANPLRLVKMFFNMHIFRQKYLSNLGLNINTVTLLFANAATINSKLINKGINLLNNENISTLPTTSVYNM